MALNEFTVEGNLTKEPETRTVNNKTVLNFGIAYTSRKRDESGNYVDGDTYFFNMTFWTDNPQYWLNHLQKGTPVICRGSLKMDKWTDKDTGKERTNVSFIVNSITNPWLDTVEEQNAKKQARNNNAGTSQPAPATTQPSAPSNTSPTYQQTTSNNPTDPNFIPF